MENCTGSGDNVSLERYCGLERGVAHLVRRMSGGLAVCVDERDNFCCPIQSLSRIRFERRLNIRCG